MERHPSFVAIVLNHVSEDSSVFRPALNCLRMLLEVLGYQLWVHSSLAPSVIRQTLVTRCFHSNKEAMHKLVFDLLPPYLRVQRLPPPSSTGVRQWGPDSCPCWCAVPRGVGRVWAGGRAVDAAPLFAAPSACQPKLQSSHSQDGAPGQRGPPHRTRPLKP